MFAKPSYTDEELQQVSLVNEKLAVMRSYAQRLDAGDTPPQDELHEFINDILETWAPLAERLGMHAEQKEMQNESVRLGYPEDYAMLKKLLHESEEMCETVFKTFSMPIRALLDDLGIEYQLNYRMKSIYSIWRKMRIDNKEFDDVYDLFATRIVYKVPEDGKISWKVPETAASEDLNPQHLSEEYLDIEKLYCWRIYNVIMMLYRVHPDRIKDWVSHPKKSGYQALQMTVMGPDCNWIEIQLRSERMHYNAEHGFAAHWIYKGEKAVK